MLVHVPDDGGAACLICEECDAVLSLAERMTIVSVWRRHARICKGGCPMPITTATHLKLTRLPAA